MLSNYLIIHKSILPDYYDKVLQTRRMLEEGKVREVSQAVKLTGISRSTYYKYKDFILEPTEFSSGRKAVLSMLLAHEQGILSAVLSCIAGFGCSVLTITQNLPVHGVASLSIALDISQLEGGINDLIEHLSQIAGVEQPKLVAVE